MEEVKAPTKERITGGLGNAFNRNIRSTPKGGTGEKTRAQ